MLELHSKVEAPPLQQRNFTDENLKRTPKTLSEAQEALSFICEKPLKEDEDQENISKMTTEIFQKLDPIKDSKGLIKANGRLSQVDLPEEVNHPILLPGEHPLTHCYSLSSQITSSRLLRFSCKSFQCSYCY